MKSSTKKVELNLTIESKVDVEGVFTPFIQGVRYTPNGDGWPDEPADFQVTKVLWHGIDITAALEKDGYDFSGFEQQAVDKISE